MRTVLNLILRFSHCLRNKPAFCCGLVPNSLLKVKVMQVLINRFSGR